MKCYFDVGLVVHVARNHPPDLEEEVPAEAHTKRIAKTCQMSPVSVCTSEEDISPVSSLL